MKMQQFLFIVSDWITQFYNIHVMRSVKDAGLTTYKTWNELSNALANEALRGSSILKQFCYQKSGLTEEEWDCIYEIKKARNQRCHPKRTWRDAELVVAGIEEQTHKKAVCKIVKVLQQSPSSEDFCAPFTFGKTGGRRWSS